LQEVRSALPNLPPRGLSRSEAAAYLGIGTTLFDRMVQDGRMPKPKAIGDRKVWDLRALDRAFDALPSEGECEHNPWDDVAA
jgi:excisionase family DNA binding protein